MAKQGSPGILPIVELLGVEAATLTNADQTVEAPVVFITIRPDPHRSWQSFSFPVGWQQAARLRDDLTRLLDQYRPAT
jgi:hypothetical protein